MNTQSRDLQAQHLVLACPIEPLALGSRCEFIHASILSVVSLDLGMTILFPVSQWAGGANFIDHVVSGGLLGLGSALTQLKNIIDVSMQDSLGFVPAKVPNAT